ncbi:MAG: hypothetical protein M3Q11_08925 [Pseudomonadota bacterium]|nr:hypothetical protein [Pseudomonadota bacterium]
MKQPASSRISRHLRAIFDEIEQVLHSMSQEAAGRAGELGTRAGRQLHGARDHLGAMESRASRELRKAGRQTRSYAQGHRWQALGGMAALALAAVMLSRRRR